MHCVNACPANAIEIDMRSYVYFQTGMAKTVKAVLDTFEPDSVFYITMLTNITPLCDCWGFSTPALVPDVGIVAGEKAALDLMDAENYIPGTLPDQSSNAAVGL